MRSTYVIKRGNGRNWRRIVFRTGFGTSGLVTEPSGSVTIEKGILYHVHKDPHRFRNLCDILIGASCDSVQGKRTRLKLVQ
jgi:hypothetical protein